MKEIAPVIKSKEQNVYHVIFNGAKTKLHQHSGGQVLIVTKGKGTLETYNKTSGGKTRFAIKKIQETKLGVGDIVYIPANRLHVHGSIDSKTGFSHVALNSYYKNKPPKTTWYESDFKTVVTKIIQ